TDRRDRGPVPHGGDHRRASVRLNRASRRSPAPRRSADPTVTLRPTDDSRNRRCRLRVNSLVAGCAVRVSADRRARKVSRPPTYSGRRRRLALCWGEEGRRVPWVSGGRPRRRGAIPIGGAQLKGEKLARDRETAGRGPTRRRSWTALTFAFLAVGGL